MISTLAAESHQLRSLGAALTWQGGVTAFSSPEHEPTEKHPH